MNPRKPFSKERKGSFTALPGFHRNFQLKPGVKEHKRLNGIITIGVIMIFSILLSSFYFEFIDYSDGQNKLMLKKSIMENREAFDFLLKSGRNRLMKNDILGAYSELKLAYNINSNKTELNNLLIETLGILCDKNEVYCKELDEILRNLNE